MTTRLHRDSELSSAERSSALADAVRSGGLDVSDAVLSADLVSFLIAALTPTASRAYLSLVPLETL